MSEEDASYYQGEFESGRTIVTVDAGSRDADARDLCDRAVERFGRTIGRAYGVPTPP